MSRDGWRFTERGDGLDGWIDDLRDLERGDDDLKIRLDRVTSEFTEALRQTMPVRTGRLKASGHWTSELNGHEYTAEVRFGDGLDYGAYVIGRHVDGEAPWDAVLPAFEGRYEAVFDAEVDL